MEKGQKNNSSKSQPFYCKTWFLVVSLICITPLGVFLWFKFSKKTSGVLVKLAKVIASIALLFIWLFLVLAIALSLTGYSTKQTFSINGKQVTIDCSSSCFIIDDYGDKNTLKILAGMGVKTIDNAPPNISGNKAVIYVDKEKWDQSLQLTLSYKGNKLVKISNTAYPSIVYYSKNGTSVAYPATDRITALRSEAKAKAKAKKEKERQQEKAREEAQAKVKAQAKAKAEEKRKREKAAEAEKKRIAKLAPDPVESIVLCQQHIKQQYPYGVKVHSILGVIADERISNDTHFYKVKVSITNAYNATRESVMECKVTKKGGSLEISYFYVY